MDLNLDTLKHEILEYLGATGLAVFHSSPGCLDGQSMVLWDSDRHPDYQMFLDVARKIGVQVILFASREFESAEIEEAVEHLEECELPREEYREYESRLHELRSYEGVTCTLELAFDYNSRLHVYEVQPDWYEEFLGIDEELISRMSGDDMDDDDSLGGYYSKN